MEKLTNLEVYTQESLNSEELFNSLTDISPDGNSQLDKLSDASAISDYEEEANNIPDGLKFVFWFMAISLIVCIIYSFA